MASVWLGRPRDAHGAELLAIKTILPHYASDLRFQRMFLDEARIAAGIHHPNVAHILDVGDEDGVLYLVMEWVDGDSLARLFRACERAGIAMPVGLACRVVADTCAGLHAAHELRGVVHHDVSPQNVLVSVRGEAKLIDFGLAGKTIGERTVKGKLLYMAPEQATGQPVDRRADLWSVGAMLYHLIAGFPPFEGESQRDTYLRLIGDAPPPPLPPHIPQEVADVIALALVRDPAERVASAEHMRRLIEDAMTESDLRATTEEVARFVQEQLADRAEARRRAVELAFEAAAQRG